MKLWLIANIVLVTSVYAVDEARRNLTNCEQRERLADPLAQVDIHDDDAEPLPDRVILPEKDQPIPEDAIAAAYLLTDDKRHFGRYFWQVVERITILPSAV